jgi:hypothetical protein
LTLTPARRVAQWVFLALVGALLMYIVLDVAENGRLDASLYRYVRDQWQSRHAVDR